MLKKLVFTALATLALAAPAIADDRGRHYRDPAHYRVPHAEHHRHAGRSAGMPPAAA